MDLPSFAMSIAANIAANLAPGLAARLARATNAIPSKTDSAVYEVIRSSAAAAIDRFPAMARIGAEIDLFPPGLFDLEGLMTAASLQAQWNASPLARQWTEVYGTEPPPEFEAFVEAFLVGIRNQMIGHPELNLSYVTVLIESLTANVALLQRQVESGQVLLETAISQQRNDTFTGVEHESGSLRALRRLNAQQYRSLSLDGRSLFASTWYLNPTLERVSPRAHYPRATAGQLAAALKPTLLLGAPGAGKSALARWIAIEVSTVRLRGHPQAAVLIAARDYADQSSKVPTDGLLGFARRQLSSSGLDLPLMMLQGHVSNGEVMFLVDGIDEVASSTSRLTTIRDIAAFHAEFSNAPLLVTSREAGARQAMDEFEDFDVYRLAPLDPHEAALFVAKWFASQGLDDGDAVAAAQRLIGGAPEIAQMAGNPLLLQMLCVAWANTAALPNSSSELSRLFVEMTLNRETSIVLEAETGLYRETVVRLAARCMADSHGHASEHELREVAVAVALASGATRRAAESWASHFQHMISERTGMLLVEVGLSDDGLRLYGFSHRMLLEELARTA